MKNSIKDMILYFKSPQGRKSLKLVTTVGVGIAVVVAGFYFYIAHINRLTYDKFIQAQKLYLNAASNKEMDKEKLKKAIKLYKEVVNQKFWWGGKEEALFYLADCLYLLKDYSGSINVLKEFEQRYRKSYFSPWVMLKLALIYEKTGKFKRAIEVYREVVKKYAQSPTAPEALLGEARCQEILGNTKEAIKIYQTLVSRYPLSAQAALGEAKLQDFNRKQG